MAIESAVTVSLAIVLLLGLALYMSRHRTEDKNKH
jgi:hypothetical protein